MLPEQKRQEFPVKETSREEIDRSYFSGDVRHGELTRIRVFHWLFKKRWFQAAGTAPNQFIFWVVLIGGFIGIQDGTKAFGTTITWYLWFFILMLATMLVGRLWCQVCPFGGFAEWIQRGVIWGKPKKRRLTLNLRWPARWATWGIIPGAIVFLIMTWAEEFYNLAGPGPAIATSYLIISIFALAVLSFLIFERRSFCRYLCPLGAVLGTFCTTGVLSGFRAKDRDMCLACDTKECMRGSQDSYGCPWFEWPGSNASALSCGLCTECYKGCPNDNIGLYLQSPLTNVHSPGKRRIDVAWTVVILWGIVWYQQWNALSWFSNSKGTGLDDILNAWMHWPRYPNPVDYLGLVGAVILAYYLFSRLVAWLAGVPWLKVFAGTAYALIPIVGIDYVVRQFPKFFDHITRVVMAISDPFGFGWNLFGTARLPIYNTKLLSPSNVVKTQVAVMLVGTVASVYAAWRIWRRDGTGKKTLLWTSLLAVLAVGIYSAVLYVAMQAAE